jgi:integrase
MPCWDRTATATRRLLDQLRRIPIAGSSWRETGLVFTTAQGGFIEPRNANRIFHNLCRKANGPQLRVHDLRHKKTKWAWPPVRKACSISAYSLAMRHENDPWRSLRGPFPLVAGTLVGLTLVGLTGFEPATSGL